MENLKTIALLSLTILSSSLYASGSTTIEIPGTSLELEANGSESNTYLNISYFNARSEINHNESSGSAGFYSLNKVSKIANHSLDIGLTKEFLRSRAFSVSVLGSAGIGQGENVVDKGVAESFFSDKLETIHYGGGVSINTNINSLGLKIQPFYSAQYMINQSEYNLSYQKSNNSNDLIHIKYDSTDNLIKHTLGVRFFNFDKSMLSILSVDYNNELNHDESVSASQGTRNLDITSNSGITRQGITFSIGFGFML